MENRLALLQCLEASLAGSHRALVALDLEAIELGTSNQWMLCRALGLGMRRRSAAEDDGADPMENSELSQELRNLGWKVLRAARVQAALLKRAQGKLHVMANMLAGSDRNYAPPLAQNNGLRICGLRAENRD